jgi:ubiquinone/menaquinone biosynthesis C-methylase UbiE
MPNLIRRSKEYVLRRLVKALVARWPEPPKAAEPAPPPPPPPRDPFSHPSFSARYFPYQPDQRQWFVPAAPSPAELDPVDGLPIPPPELWVGYGPDLAEYLNGGREHFACMRKVLADEAFSLQPGDRVLDFGCAAGRMIRCLKPEASQYEIWGVDIFAATILWCQQHLGEWFRFLTSTTSPHLPFEDGYFNFIYAGSVFTHIGDLEDAWLMELRRILKPGGLMYLTMHDNRTIDVILSSPPGHLLHDTSIRKQLIALDAELQFTTQGYKIFMTSRAPGNTQVFHDKDYIQQHWGRYLTVRGFYPETYGYQAAVTLGKKQ